jgi:hypothetical protein
VSDGNKSADLAKILAAKAVEFKHAGAEIYKMA